MNPLILLKNAAQNGDVNKLYQAIAKDSNVLEHYDKTPFAETPLHIAASRGHINFALEIMRLKPSLSKKLDEQGWSPMHVALQHNQTAMVYRLIETEPTLVGVKGREGFTPLHYVAQNDEVKLLREFLAVSPHSIMDTTNKGETALHIAVEKGNTRALEALLSFLRRSWYREALYWEEKLVNWKDENGFTVLHVAVKMNDIQVVKSLLKFKINVNAKSLEGLTVLDIVDRANNNPDMKDVLIQAGAEHSHVMKTNDINAIPSMKQVSFEPKPTLLDNVIRFLKGQKTNISTETRDALLVVAALVATATFQAVLSPPGGLRQADSSDSDSLPFSKVGKVVMKEWLYITFLILNSISFWVTIITIYLLLPNGFYGQLLTLPLILFSITYLFCSTIISPSLICAIVNFSFFIFCVVLLSLGLVLISNHSSLSYIKKLWSRCR
ncbi:hypothetical protein E1A91_A03G010500v1 [Gossypium mustelinum]|uniref:PGG domain-containing protein n=1 Tax=Gossypium mustelinum TaxID=34275 RepID=A0A5D2ZT72_GOSMU|nr:hypothetical protein E1A91_A03G010500v1 [Gossypium mustelinum]